MLRSEKWVQHAICPVIGVKRGRLAVSKKGKLFIILPDSNASTIKILQATREGTYSNFEEIWYGYGFLGEPLVDTARIDTDDVLTVLTVSTCGDANKDRLVVALDFRV